MAKDAASKQNQIGRGELVAELSTRCAIPVEVAKSVVHALFGLGGQGPVFGHGREGGIIERFLAQGIDVNIRGFGRFRSVRYKSTDRMFYGREVTCPEKMKISFKASRATDIKM